MKENRSLSAIHFVMKIASPISPRWATALVFAAMAWNTPAAAGPVSYTWTMSGSHGPLEYGNELEFSSSGDPSRTLKVRSYSSTSSGAALMDAYTDLFSGGIGVKNQSESGSSPNHAIDNSGWHNDLVLFEFDSDDYTALSFRIGWRTSDSDIRIWLGGSGANLDLAGASVSDFAGLGFIQLSVFWYVAVDTAIDIDTDVAGRYMIVTGGNETYKDYFKFNQIVAGVAHEDHAVPERATLAVFGIGLAGIVLSRRRKRA